MRIMKMVDAQIAKMGPQMQVSIYCQNGFWINNFDTQ